MSYLKKSKWFIALISALLLFTVFPISAFAEDTTGSIAVSYPLEGTEFRLYKVAVPDGKGGFAMTEEFAEYNIDFSDESAADTLQTIVLFENNKQIDTKTSQIGGFARFENLDQGVYLIIGNPSVVDGKTYTPVPVLLSLPQWEIADSGKKSAVWDVKVSDKYEVMLGEKDDGEKSDTPSEQPSESPSKDTPNVTPQDVNVTNQSSGQSNPTLPRTGQNWWQVFALVGVGTICLLFGLIRRMRYE